MFIQLPRDGLLDDLGHEREVQHWPEIGHVGCVEPRLFEQENKRKAVTLITLQQSKCLSYSVVHQDENTQS